MDDARFERLNAYWLGQDDAFRGGPIRKLARRDQVLRLVWLCHAEVENGGFAQFFGNSAGDDAALTSKAFEEIGALDVAEVVSEAVKMLGWVLPFRSRWLRCWRLERLSVIQEARLEALDGRLIAASERVSELLYAYLYGQNPEMTGARA